MVGERKKAPFSRDFFSLSVTKRNGAQKEGRTESDMENLSWL